MEINTTVRSNQHDQISTASRSRVDRPLTSRINKSQVQSAAVSQLRERLLALHFPKKTAKALAAQATPILKSGKKADVDFAYSLILANYKKHLGLEGAETEANATNNSQPEAAGKPKPWKQVFAELAAEESTGSKAAKPAEAGGARPWKEVINGLEGR